MKVIIATKAQKQVNKLDGSVVAKIVAGLAKLEDYPEITNVEVLTGDFQGLFRLRVGDYRIVFSVDGDEITVHFIGNRRDVYD